MNTKIKNINPDHRIENIWYKVGDEFVCDNWNDDFLIDMLSGRLILKRHIETKQDKINDFIEANKVYKDLDEHFSGEFIEVEKLRNFLKNNI